MTNELLAILKTIAEWTDEGDFDWHGEVKVIKGVAQRALDKHECRSEPPLDALTLWVKWYRGKTGATIGEAITEFKRRRATP